MGTVTKESKSTEKKQSHLNDLYSISNIACERVEELLESLDIEYKKVNNLFYCSCPIHDGDNETAVNLYVNDTVTGKAIYWKCNTHGCHLSTPQKPSIFTFVQLTLQSKHNEKVSFLEAKNYIISTLKIDPDNISKYAVDTEKSNFVSTVNVFKKEERESVEKHLTKDYWMRNLQIPSKYYLDRGYSANVLMRHMVGESVKGYTAGRVLVPILHNDGKIIIGWTARATSPTEEPKWLHSKGLHTKNCLYNYWNAEKFVKENNHLIVVEGPGDVWKLDQAGIYNSVAIFGNSVSESQQWLINTLPIIKITILTDNDAGGDIAEANIRKNCDRLYNIKRIKPADGYKDVGEMPVEEIRKLKL